MSLQDARAERLTVDQGGGRRKVYRPLDAESRQRALEAGLAAYRRGDFFEAHELLEPAWMGTDDLAERALYQGLIKLAAAYVHAVRGNPIGMARNLQGARQYLKNSARIDPSHSVGVGIDLPALVAAMDERLESLRGLVDRLAVDGGAGALSLAEGAPAIRQAR